MLLILLDREGICASSGSACLDDSDELAHVIKAMKPDSADLRQLIRFSINFNNSEDEIEETLSCMRRVISILVGN